jgi:transposase
MIVVGVDPHKQTHTAVAVSSPIGELAGELTVRARPAGHEELLSWARGLGQERLFALEDCRHVSGSLERFLIGSGERVVRVPPKLMGESRRSARSFGKSDPIDALAVARAALREDDLPAASPQGPAFEIKLLLDHREDLVAEQTRVHNRLRWHLHDLDPDFELPPGRLSRAVWLDRLGRRLRRLEGGVRLRLCRDRKGNRQLNLALHRIAVAQGRLHAPAKAFLERKRAEGKSRREALRCLKRHLARVVFKLLKAIALSSSEPQPEARLNPALSTSGLT